MLERHHLRILKAVHKNGSLSAAADELCLTQSALSHAIKKLENLLNIKLWTNSGRNIQFTEEGEYLLELADRVLPQFMHAETEIRAFSEGQKGVLRIGMECHPCYRWLLKAVRLYMQQWDNVDLDVKQEFQFGGMAALLQKDIDLLVTPDPLHSNEVAFHRMMDYELVLVTAENHPLAKKDYIIPQDLINETLITYPVAQSRLDIYSQFLIPEGVLPHTRKIMESTDIMLEMVAAGRGVTPLPSWMMEDLRGQFAFDVVRIGKNGIHKSLWVGTRNQTHKPYVEAFLNIAKTALDQNNL